MDTLALVLDEANTVETQYRRRSAVAATISHLSTLPAINRAKASYYSRGARNTSRHPGGREEKEICG